MKAWKLEEIAILTRDFPSQGSESVAALLGRSRTSVRHKASRLKLRSDGSHFQRSARKNMDAATARGVNCLEAWKKRVKERDDFTCQACGLHEPLIVSAHHIRHIANGGDPFSVTNGITLCPNCHALEHAIRGRKTSGRRVTPETYKQIRNLFEQGVGIEAIAKHVGHNRKTVAAHTSRRTIPISSL